MLARPTRPRRFGESMFFSGRLPRSPAPSITLTARPFPDPDGHYWVDCVMGRACPDLGQYSLNFGEQIKAVEACFGDCSGVGSAIVLLRISYILLTGSFGRMF